MSTKVLMEGGPMAEYERLPDHVEIVEEYEDGTTIRYGFKDLPRPADDPYVRRRQARDDAAESEIVSEFGPAPERPTTYPAALPFIADRAVVTTESPDGSMSTGARWVCVDAGALAEQVVDSSVADGWDVVDGTRLSRALPVPPRAVLRRGGVTRMVTTVVEPGLSILQLTDVKE
jgi:hypothetical protein